MLITDGLLDLQLTLNVNDHNGYTKVIAGKVEKAVTGQADNRYAYFLIPEGCNYVVVDIENNTVLFDIK